MRQLDFSRGGQLAHVIPKTLSYSNIGINYRPYVIELTWLIYS